MKFIHTGDWHLGGNYPEKAQASADHLIAQIHDPSSPAFRPDGILMGGDLTDRALHIHSDRLKPFYDLVKATTCPIILLQGTPSHEPIGTINNIATLSDRIRVIDSPDIQVHMGGACIAGMPGLSKAFLAKWMDEIGSDVNAFESPTMAIKEALGNIGEYWRQYGKPIRILLGHWTLAGCMTPTGQTMIGDDLEVGLADLAAINPSIVLLNHIHQAQSWTVPAYATYSGPPYPTSWGELDQKTFTVVEFDDATGAVVKFTRVPFPHKPMVQVHITFTGEIDEAGGWDFTDKPDIELYEMILSGQAEVKCKYTVPKPIASQVTDITVRTIFHRIGVELAAIERIIQAGETERIADIGSKQTTRDQYLAVCEAKGKEPRPGALAKADEIDREGIGR